MSTNESPVSHVLEALQESPAIICSKCGYESTLPELFRNRTAKPLCPGCAQKHDWRNAQQAAKGMPMLLLLALLAGLLASFDMPPLSTFGVITFNLLLLILWTFPLLWLYPLMWKIQCGTR